MVGVADDDVEVLAFDGVGSVCGSGVVVIPDGSFVNDKTVLGT